MKAKERQIFRSSWILGKIFRVAPKRSIKLKGIKSKQESWKEAKRKRKKSKKKKPSQRARLLQKLVPVKQQC